MISYGTMLAELWKATQKRLTLAKRTRKTTQVWKTRTCVRTCDGWPNGFTSRLASSRKSQKVVNFTHIQLTCDQLVRTCIGWPNDEKHASTLRANLSSTKVNPWQPKWVAKRNASWTQVENLCRLASPFGQGLDQVSFRTVMRYKGLMVRFYFHLQGTNEILRMYIALTGMQHAGKHLQELVK